MTKEIPVLAHEAIWQATQVMLDAGVDDQEAYAEQIAEAIGDLTQEKDRFNAILTEVASQKPFLAYFLLQQVK